MCGACVSGGMFCGAAHVELWAEGLEGLRLHLFYEPLKNKISITYLYNSNQFLQCLDTTLVDKGICILCDAGDIKILLYNF